MFIYNRQNIINSTSENEVIILESRSLNLISLNSWGWYVLIKFCRPVGLDEVKYAIINEFIDLPSETVDKELNYFINELIQNNLIIQNESAEEVNLSAQILYNQKPKTAFELNINVITDMSEGFFSKIFVEE